MNSPSNKIPLLLDFGDCVREQRLARGLSQEAFADACEIDRSYMGGIERGERNLALINIMRIVHALELEPSEFFKGLDSPSRLIFQTKRQHVTERARLRNKYKSEIPKTKKPAQAL